MKHHVQCDSPDCNKYFTVSNPYNYGRGKYCTSCRERHSTKVLTIQREHELTIQEVICEGAQYFSSAESIADYIGVSFVTVYNWIEKYFGFSFQEFRRKYICKSTRCYSLNIKRASYSKSDYILKKLRDKRYCSCVSSLDPNYIMTCAPIYVVTEVLKGSPKIEKVSDKVFEVAPNQVKFGFYKVVHFCSGPVYFTRSKPVYWIDSCHGVYYFSVNPLLEEYLKPVSVVGELPSYLVEGSNNLDPIKLGVFPVKFSTFPVKTAPIPRLLISDYEKVTVSSEFPFQSNYLRPTLEKIFLVRIM